MSRLALYLLGSPRVVLDDAPVEIGRRKVLALLAYLAVTAQRHSRDELATLLWPESSQRNARASLRRTLYTINKAFGEEILPTGSDMVHFDPELVDTFFQIKDHILQIKQKYKNTGKSIFLDLARNAPQ